MYVYILQCSDGSYYIGVTNNLDLRIQQHQNGSNEDSYTKNRRPVKLVFYEKFQTPEAAILMEKKLKGWSRAKKEALINGQLMLLPGLSKCKNTTSHNNFDKT